MREIINAALDHIEKLSYELHKTNKEKEQLEELLNNIQCKDEGFNLMVKHHQENDSKK